LRQLQERLDAITRPKNAKPAKVDYDEISRPPVGPPPASETPPPTETPDIGAATPAAPTLPDPPAAARPIEGIARTLMSELSENDPAPSAEEMMRALKPTEKQALARMQGIEEKLLRKLT